LKKSLGSSEMKISVFWFRRDLRIEDNTALLHALGSGFPVLSIFIFDRNITDDLSPDDARITFIHDRLKAINEQLIKQGGCLRIFQGHPGEIWGRLIAEFEIAAVFINRDYEPYARERDLRIKQDLEQHGVPLYDFKDHVIFEPDEVVKNDGSPYTIFTPYKKKWLEKFFREAPVVTKVKPGPGLLPESLVFPSLEELGFARSSIEVKPYDLSLLDRYSVLRDYPAANATSHLSPHLRFGTVSIRKIVSELGEADQTFLGELIWREFFVQILHHFPHVVTRNFNPRYNGIEWRNREDEFERWCGGQTGYPIVDAGMRQLNRTGTMHNRVRMVTASFLCKHLLIDWRWGEAYFAEKLLDYELSSNNGNWQWAAGTGCDAAPYFRVFNPQEQQRKFDLNLEYVRRWVPEYGTPSYPRPIIEHRFARTRAIKVYRNGIGNYLPGS
jgi:deoxyribodipyrimidine photo-lyase